MESLTVNGLSCKPHVFEDQKWHLSHMRFGSPDLDKALKLCQTELQRMFLRRLDEEMKEQKISANALAAAARLKGLELSQVSVSRILRGAQDPTLEKIHAISEVLGIPAWALLTDEHTVEQRVFHRPSAERSNIRKLPAVYPRWSEQIRRKKARASTSSK